MKVVAINVLNTLIKDINTVIFIVVNLFITLKMDRNVIVVIFEVRNSFTKVDICLVWVVFVKGTEIDKITKNFLTTSIS